MAKKKTVKKVKKVEDTVLSEVEMLKMEKNEDRVRFIEGEIEKLKLKNEIIKTKAEMEILKNSQVVLNIINSDLKNAKDKRTKFSDEIKEKFNINTDKFGYDPQSGEIKL